MAQLALHAKRNDEMEEEVPAVHSVSLQLAEHGLSLASCWHVCSGKNFNCNSVEFLVRHSERIEALAHNDCT